MKINQLKLGSLLTYAQMALSIGINLVYTPIMIRCLGQSEYGLYQTALSVISMMSVLNLGFSNSYIRYYSKFKSDGNDQAIFRLNGQLTLIMASLGLVTLVCGLFLSFNLELVFSTGLTANEYKIARILLLLLTFDLSVSFPASVLGSIISAHERFVFLKLLGMLRSVLSPLVTLPLLLMGFRSVAMVSVTVALSAITNICYFYYVKIILKHKFIFRDFSPSLLKDMAVYTGFIAINMLIDQVNWNISKVMLGRYWGTVEVSVYSVGYALFTYYMMFSTSISGVFTPRIHGIVNTIKEPRELKAALTELFVRVGRIQFLILALIASGFVFFGEQFMLIWAGKGYERSYYVLLLLCMPASIALIQNIGIEIQRAQNKHKFRSFCYSFMAVLNFACCLILCRDYGAVGAAVGTAVSLVVANGIIMNFYYHLKCNIDIVSFWKSICRMSVGLAGPVLFGILLKHFVQLETIFMFAICVVVYTGVYCLSMWLIGMNKYEKNLLLGPIRKFVKR